MITRSDFFDALAKGALWDVGVAINRTNPLPLDKFSVFESLGTVDDTGTDTALGYAMNSVIAYPGQIIAVVGGTNDAPTVNIYSILKTGKASIPELILKELASQGSYTQLSTVLIQLDQEVVKSVTGDKAVKATLAGNAVTLATQTSAVNGNILEIKDDGLYVPAPEAVTVPEYSIVKDESSSDYAAVYHLTKNKANVGVAINIPKDKVVKSGTVERYTAGNLPAGVTEAGTYVVLVFENVADPCYINVKDLVDVYTGDKDSKGSGENTYSTIQVNVDDKNKITATVLDGAIHTAELADRAVTGAKIALNGVLTENIASDAVVARNIASGAISTDKIADNAVTADKINDGEIGTSKLADGAVTEGKLAPDLKTAIGKANSAIQEVALESGTNNGTLKLTIDGTATDNISVTGLGTAAYEAKTAFDAAGAAAAVLGDATTDTAETATVHGVKKKAEANATEITALKNGKVDKLQAQSSGLNYNVYTVSPTGEQTGVGTVYGGYDSDEVWSYGGGTIVTAESTGCIPATWPTKAGHVATKQYVDNSLLAPMSDIATLQTSVETLNGDATKDGSVAKSVKDAIDALDVPAVTGSDTDHKFVSGVSQEDGKIKVVRQALTEADLPSKISQDRIEDLGVTLAGKQDILDFEGTPSADNKVITKSAMDSAISTATAGLTGAMHFIGNSTTDPLTGPTIADHTGTFKSGDVCTFELKEYVYDGTSWRELGDESSYAVKGSIKNADIATDAKIAQSKIDGLTTALDNKVEGATITDNGLLNTYTVEVANKKLQLYTADAEHYGLVKLAESGDNRVYRSNNDEALHVYSITTDILKNGTNTLILNGGGAAL